MSYELSRYMRGVKTRVDEAIQSVVDNIASNHGLDENAQIKCYGEIQAELIKDWQAATPKILSGLPPLSKTANLQPVR